MAENVEYASDEIREFVAEGLSLDLCCGNTFSDTLSFADERTAWRANASQAENDEAGRKRAPLRVRKAAKKEMAAR